MVTIELMKLSIGWAKGRDHFSTGPALPSINDPWHYSASRRCTSAQGPLNGSSHNNLRQSISLENHCTGSESFGSGSCPIFQKVPENFHSDLQLVHIALPF
jgi:hypothetical protein